jgi:hypothetical protein
MPKHAWTEGDWQIFAFIVTNIMLLLIAIGASR